jgi:type I restriction enzyme, S subunit
MKFSTYPRYKSSNIEWLGDIPQNWEVKRLKFISREPIKNGIGAPSDTDDPELPRYVRITDIKSARELHTDSFRSLPKELADTAKFTVGDILFACVGATFGKSYLHRSDIGPVCYAGYLAKYSPQHSVDPRFVSYWCASGPFWGQLNANVIQSTVQNFSASKYRELVLALPPSEEQRLISAFLDRETTRMDGLLAKKRELIERLTEKRTALVSHTVTGGLPPVAARAAGFAESPLLKPSALNWLGKIPRHWRMLRLKNVSPRISGRLVFQPAQYFDVEGVPFLMGNNVTERGIKWDDVKLIPDEINKRFARHALKEGDVVTVRVGAPGLTSVVPKEAEGLNCGSLMIIRRSTKF